MGLPKGRTNNVHGRKKGTKNNRTLEWETLKSSITGDNAEHFQEFMYRLWSSPDPKDHLRAAELFLQILEYFKPKQSRIQHTGDQGGPVQIIAPDNI